MGPSKKGFRLTTRARLRRWLFYSRRTLRQRARGAARPATMPLLAMLVLLPALVIGNALTARAANGTMVASALTFPFNGVWLDGTTAGHYWNATGDAGLCRVDASATSPTGFVQNAAACDFESKKPTQVVVGPQNADGTYYVYQADMASKSGGPIRVTFDPKADGGNGLIVPNSAVPLGGLNTVGFFADATKAFLNSSVALGPCNHSNTNPVVENATTGPCLALYLAFERSKKIERINWVDKPANQQTIEDISETADPRKGVRYGIAPFKNADGTTDLYIDELGGLGVSRLTDLATCPPNVNGVGGCGAAIVPGIGTTFPQGIAVQTDANGIGQSLYVADVPQVVGVGSTVLRYTPGTGRQDIISAAVPAYQSLLNPGETVTTYQYIVGLAINPHTGDLFIGDDPTFTILVNPPLAKGHLWMVPGGATPDCVASLITTCNVPPAPSQVVAGLYAYGMTAPAGGTVFLPSADGGHYWLGDHTQGFCRLDQVPGTSLHALNPNACDDGDSLGSSGQAVYDDTVNADGTHFVYVAQNDHLSPGVWRFKLDPNADNGAGALLPSPAIMAPSGGLNGDKANGLALGPCAPQAPVTCKHALYMGGLLDGFIRRINNPEDDPRIQTVQIVAMTTDQKGGVVGRGINGSIGMIGDDLYLPENTGFTVVHNVGTCPTVTAAGSGVCSTTPLPIGQFGFIFGAGIATDPDPTHSTAGLVYASVSPGASDATIYQYDVASGRARIYATQGQMPAAGTADAQVYCTTICTRPGDPVTPPGSLAPFVFAQGLYVDPNSGSLVITDDRLAGARGGHGHMWIAPFEPYPAPPPGTPTATPVPTRAPAVNCSMKVSVPLLLGGMTYWAQFTQSAPGPITATWTLPFPQSAALAIYAGNPFAGQVDPVAGGLKGKPLAVLNASNTTSFSVVTTSQPAGTYTVQFFNAGGAIVETSGTVGFTNLVTGPACPTQFP